METIHYSLNLNYVENNEYNIHFFNYKLEYNSKFPKELDNILAPYEFYRIIDTLNSKPSVRPHFFIILLLQSISLYVALQIMVLTNSVNRNSCSVFFLFVLLHLVNALILFGKCIYQQQSYKQKKFLRNLNNQFLFRDIKFSNKFDERGNIFTISFLGRFLFLIVPFFIQLNIISDTHSSKYIYLVGYIVASIFILILINIMKTLFLFSKYKDCFISNDQSQEFDKLFLMESFIITYTRNTNSNSLISFDLLNTPGNIISFENLPLIKK